MKKFEKYLKIIIFIMLPHYPLCSMDPEKTDRHIFQLPPEMERAIFNLLPQNDFLNSRLVCLDWEKACRIHGVERIFSLSSKKLDIEECKILTNLPFSNLLLKDCQFTHNSLRVLSQSGKYKKIYMNNTTIGDTGVRTLATGKLTSLTSLSLNNQKIRYPEMYRLAHGNLTSLKSLSLNNATITPAELRALTTGNLTSLTSLDLSGNNIDDEGTKALIEGNLPSLTFLNLNENKISNDGRQELIKRFAAEINF